MEMVDTALLIFVLQLVLYEISSFQLSAQNVREEYEAHRILNNFFLLFNINLRYPSVLPRTLSDSHSLLASNPAGGRSRKDW